MANETLDALVEAAWRQFRKELADVIDRSAARTVTVAQETADGGHVTLVRITATERELVSLVTAGSALPPSLRPARSALAQLRALGWTRPSRISAHYAASTPSARVDELAVHVTTVLREVFAVLHPAFLRLDPPPPVVSEVVREPLLARMVVLPRPRSGAELTGLVSAALAGVLGHEVQQDEDGDFAISTSDGVVFLRPCQDVPVVRLFSDLVVEVADLDEAAIAVADLNAEVGGVTFVLEDAVITANVDVLALPFVGEHLLAHLARLCSIVDEHSASLAERVDGETFVGAADSVDDTVRNTRAVAPTAAAAAGTTEAPGAAAGHAPDAIHPVMLQLLQLDADEPGSLSPDDVAEICSHNADLIVELIWWNEEQEIEWRMAREEAEAATDAAESAACEHERAHAARTITLLRKALRRTLLKR